MADTFNLTVNGTEHRITSDGDRPLLDVLREELGLTGTKYGCGEGACGACTVIIENQATRSCITSIAEVGSSAVETIEGLATGDQLHAVQQAFIDKAAMQCGYCVPGQIMNAVALLREQPHANRQQVVEAMNGNLCRCCNYRNLRDAVEQAAGS